MHATVYVAVNGLLVAGWVLFGGGTVAEARASLTDLDDARTYGFWPLYIMVAWGAALVIHAGAAASLALRRVRKRRRRRRSTTTGAGDALAPAGHAAMSSTERSGRDAPPGRRWLAVMFTDVVSSTDLVANVGDEAFAESLRRHRSTVRGCIAAHDGAEVGTQGDGFLIRFATPDAAVACAVALQGAGPFGDDPDALPVRVGIHAGEVVHDDTDDDLVGRVVHLASRVTDAAAAGEILVTEAVADHLQAPIALTDRGLVRLKGFDRPRHLLSVAWQSGVDVVDLDAADHSPA